MEYKGDKKHIIEQIEKLKEAEYICYIWKKENKEAKTRQQEKTYYKILNAISKHLWYTTQEVKIYILSWCFWTKPLKLNREYMEIPVISETKKLTKEQWIFFIDTLLAFTKLKNVPVEITSREVQDLYLSYN